MTKTPADYWERCPVCRARMGEAPRCARCGMDFGPALRAAEESERLTDRSRDRLAAGDPAGALEDGQRAVRLHEQPEALRRLAVAALAARRFEEAVDAWRRLRDFDRRTQG